VIINFSDVLNLKISFHFCRFKPIVVLTAFVRPSNNYNNNFKDEQTNRPT